MFTFTGEKVKGDSGDCGQRGFTLVELMITVFLVILFLAGAVAIVAQGFTFQGVQQNLAALNREGNDTLDRLEILILGCDEITDGEGNTNEEQFTFYSDINQSGSGELIVINSSGSDLLVKILDVTSTVLSDLDTPLEFNYYEDWKHENEIFSNYDADLRVVKITIHLTKTSAGDTMKKTYHRYVLLKMSPEDRSS